MGLGQGDVADDGGEQVVIIMGDATGQGGNGVQFSDFFKALSGCEAIR